MGLSKAISFGYSFTLVVVGVLIGLVMALFNYIKNRNKDPPQVSRHRSGLLISGLEEGTSLQADLPFHGVRVLELSTVVAGPMAARVMSDLGAEVIKVEDVKGDPFRNVFCEYEYPRPYGSAFEVCNLGKASVKLNLKTAEGKAKIMDLLADADVFITNVRVDALVRLGLDYESIRVRVPHLTYASLTAYGRDGPDCGLPGYDVGAFWATTGMSALVQQPNTYVLYPAGFGDLTTGGAMVGGIAASLTRRLKTGQGSLVDASLLRSGYYCNSTTLCNATPDERPTLQEAELRACGATEPPTYRHYTCADGAVSILGRDESHDAIWSKINIAFGEGVPKRTTPEALSEKLKTLPMEEVEARLRNMGVDCASISNLVTNVRKVQADQPHLFEQAPPGFDDVGMIPRKPFVFGLAPLEAQRPKTAAPAKGIHTREICETGFQPRAADLALPLPKKGGVQAGSALAPNLPLEGVTVVELSWGLGLSAAACSHQLMAAGATVIKVVDSTKGDPLKTKGDPRVYEQFNSGKEVFEVDVSFAANLDPRSRQRSTPLLTMIADRGAICVVTNAPTSVLEVAGLVPPQGARRGEMDVVVAVISPWGIDGPEDSRGDLGAFWGRSGMGAGVSGQVGGDDAMRPLPPQMGEIITSMQAFTAVSAAIFHHKRHGDGQIVDISMERTGLWCVVLMSTWVSCDPHKGKLWEIPPSLITERWPVPTLTSITSKDGVSIQLLGLDLARHLLPTMNGLNVPKTVWLTIILTVVFKVIPEKAPTKVLKLVPLLVVFNKQIQHCARQLTFDELVVRFEKAGVWWTLVKSPGQAMAYQQAAVTGAFADADGDKTAGRRFIAAPVQVKS